MKLILPNTSYGNIEQLAKLIKEESNAKLANRFNAIRLLMSGYKQQEVANVCGITRTAVMKWVKKWNQSGKEELTSKSGGSRSKVTPEIRMEISKVINVEKQIGGRVVTGKLIWGYLKKTPG